MTEPVVFKRSLSIAFITLLRALAPAVVAVGMIYVIARGYNIKFGSHFLMMAVLVGILAPTIMQPPRLNTLQWGAGRWSLVAMRFPQA